MELDVVVRALRIEDSVEAFAVDWRESQTAMPIGELPFLRREFVERACEATYLPRDMMHALMQAARRIASDDALRALAWHCHWTLYRTETDRWAAGRWPLLTAALGADAGLFNVLALFSGTPRMQAFHRTRGIPADVVRDTVADVRHQMERGPYTEDHGRWGILPHYVAWFLRTWRGNLFRLGRFNLAFGPSRPKLRAFRHRTDGTVVAVSESGVRYRSDGQVDGAGGVHDEDGAWTSDLSITDEAIVGHPIDPAGYAVRASVRLPADQWQVELKPDDPIIEIHIPGGSPMTYEACGQSLRRALEFFPRYFPDQPFVAFTCQSWLLDPQIQDLMPTTSNLARFQKETYLFPIQSSGESTIRTVFGRGTTDVAAAPRDTTMQRAFAKHLERGGHFRAGGCFLLPADLDWGSQFYRRQRLPWSREL